MTQAGMTEGLLIGMMAGSNGAGKSGRSERTLEKASGPEKGAVAEGE